MPSTAIIRGWNCGVACAGVTVRNLVVRNSAYNCIGAYATDNWTIDQNELTGCGYGVNIGAGANARITRNRIHHNTTGGYGSSRSTGYLWEGNEIAYNAAEQKVTQTTNTTFRGNWLHHNVNGIWYDGDNVGSLIEGNTVEDHAGDGIFYEISGQGIIRDNVVRRSGNSGVFLSTSRDVDVYGNTLEDNFRGVNLFVYCPVVGPAGYPYPGAIGFGLRNLAIHDNLTSSRPGALAAVLSSSGCTPEQFAPYVNREKAIAFAGNTYQVSDAASYWFWGGYRTFPGWQALGFDAGAYEPPPDPEPVPEPTPTAPTCALYGAVYQQGERTDVRVKTGQATQWLADHPGWALVASRPVNRTWSQITIECRP